MMPRTIHKPWGREIWWANNKHYAAKILVIKSGHRLSLQYHKKKHETIYTLEGVWLLIIDGHIRFMSEGSVEAIRPGTRHRLEAPFGKVVLLEASTPHLKDVVRLEDDYKRAKKINV